ncbi:uncharacterized protein LOC128619928 isoform X5 [Ictalurus furcatus]|uniref:uncharacterized protein LOC128619928 isoform X5 n=1 Tax=Ictalurus furcatus TaxID=66913 RepID=UPI0023507DAC|nr:uncharacterized protein LOC128619928 isoform X5 [Ictalurus furcatus]
MRYCSRPRCYDNASTQTRYVNARLHFWKLTFILFTVAYIALKNLDTLLHCVCNKQIKMEKKWGSNRSVDLKRMCPQQKARYLAYAEPSKEIQAWMAACHKRIHSRLAHEREKAWGKNPLQDLDSKLHQDTLIGQLKAAEARNRIRQMTLHCHNLKMQEINLMISSQVSMQSAVRLELLLAKEKQKNYADSLDQLQCAQLLEGI